MENNVTPFNDDSPMFLKQPPRIMGLGGYFMEPPNNGNGSTGSTGDNYPILKELGELMSATQGSITKLETSTVGVIDDLQKEVVLIRKSVSEIESAIAKNIKEQQKFQTEQLKYQKLADRYRRQMEAKSRTNLFGTRSKQILKGVGRDIGGGATSIVSGIIDTLLPGFAKMGGTRVLMNTFKAGGAGLLGLLCGLKAQKDFQKKVNNSLGVTERPVTTRSGAKISDLISNFVGGTKSRAKSIGNVINDKVSSAFQGFSQLFKGGKGRTVSADVLDEAGNVVGKTSATIKETRKFGLVGRMFGRDSSNTKKLVRSFDKNIVSKPSTALVKSVGKAGTSLVESFVGTGKNIAEVASKGMATAMRALGTAVMTAGRALIAILSNPVGLASVLGALGIGALMLNINDFMKNPEKHPFISKFIENHPIASNLLGIGAGDDFKKDHPLLDKLTDRTGKTKTGEKISNVPGVGKDVVALRDLGLQGTIASINTKPYIHKSSVEGMKALDQQLAQQGLRVVYTSAMGGHDPKSGHGRGRKIDFQTPNRVLTPAEYESYYKQGYFGGLTGAIGYEYGGKKTVTTPAEYAKLYKEGKVHMMGADSAHYDFNVALGGFSGALTKAMNSVTAFGDSLRKATPDGFTPTSTRPTLTHGKLTPDQAIALQAQKAKSYQSMASGMSVYETQMDREAKAKAQNKIYEPNKYETQYIEPNKYTTPQIKFNPDSSISTPGIDMGVLELTQAWLQS